MSFSPFYSSKRFVGFFSINSIQNTLEMEENKSITNNKRVGWLERKMENGELKDQWVVLKENNILYWYAKPNVIKTKKKRKRKKKF